MPDIAVAWIQFDRSPVMRYCVIEPPALLSKLAANVLDPRLLMRRLGGCMIEACRQDVIVAHQALGIGALHPQSEMPWRRLLGLSRKIEGPQIVSSLPEKLYALSREFLAASKSNLRFIKFGEGLLESTTPGERFAHAQDKPKRGSIRGGGYPIKRQGGFKVLAQQGMFGEVPQRTWMIGCEFKRFNQPPL
jgi:hypothetical protein